MQDRSKTSMAMAGGLLLLLLPLAIPAQATTNSDYASQNDYCTAYDVDNMYSNPPSGDANSCDGDSEDTYVLSTYNGGVLTSCANAWTPTADASECQGGFIFNDDDASAAGGFGGDFAIAASVEITADDPSSLDLATGFNIRTTYMYYATEVVVPPAVPSYTAGQTVTTITGPACIADRDLAVPPAGSVGSVIVDDSGDPWDYPVGAPVTIIQVVGFRAPVGGAPCGLPNSAGPREVYGDWTYTGEVDDMSAEAVIDQAPLDNGDGTCSFKWHFSANSAGRWGQATGSLDIDGGLVFGYFDQSTVGVGASVTADEVSTGIDTILYGEWVTVAASVWGVGGVYKQDQDPVGTSGPMDRTFLCSPGLPPDGNALLEPICAATGVSDGAGGWTVPVTGVCVSGDLGSVPPLVYACLPSGANAVVCAPPGATCNGFGNLGVAVATGGASRSVLTCDATVINDADTAPLAPSPLALVGPTASTAGAWSCTVTFTPAAGTPSVHAGACIGNL